MTSLNLTFTQIIRKTFKLGLRGGATLFIPFMNLPLFGVPFVGGFALHCGVLISIPLWIIWVQTIFAWVDDSLRWF